MTYIGDGIVRSGTAGEVAEAFGVTDYRLRPLSITAFRGTMYTSAPTFRIEKDPLKGTTLHITQGSVNLSVPLPGSERRKLANDLLEWASYDRIEVEVKTRGCKIIKDEPKKGLTGIVRALEYQFATFNSSVVKRVVYNQQTKDLWVEFVTNGRIWQYANVQYETFAALCNASSIGSYYTTEIKGQFPSMSVVKFPVAFRI
jgi:hypothetical protein